MSPAIRRVLLGVAAIAAAFGTLWMIDNKVLRPGRDQTENEETPVFEKKPRVDMGMMPAWSALNEEMALVTDRVMPGVVSIQIQRRRAVEEEVNRGGGFRKETREITEPGVGSGSIVTRDGHILTNWHVVDGGENSITVTLSGEESARPAKLVDKDEQRDLALLKIEPHDAGEQFSALRLGDSGKLRRGHMVLAMGSPFGLRETVTHGIISHRARRVSDTYTSYLQTSCVINPGNSGGPLVDLQGDMVGIVTRKLLGPEGQASTEGYGLAIPSDDLKLAVDSFMNKGRAQPYVGVTVEDWPEQYWLKQEEAEAVAVKGVTRDSPAEKAGLKVNDVIESLDGERTTNTYGFWRRVRLHKPGETLAMIIRRDKETKQLQLVLADLPQASTKPAFGVIVRRLRPWEEVFLSNHEPGGLCVESVAPDSPLSNVLKQGMYVLHISASNSDAFQPLTTAEEFRSLLEEFAATGGKFLLGEAGKPGFMRITFPPLR